MSEEKSYKRLYRSKDERVIAGVCGGLAEYFNVDPVVMRILAIFAVFSGVGILAYIAAIFIVPENPKQKHVEREIFSETAETEATAGKGSAKLVFGALMVFFGAVILLERFDLLDAGWFHFSLIPWRLFFPAMLIVVGIVLLTNGAFVDKTRRDVRGWASKSRLSKSRSDKAISGVSGGIGRALNIDSGIVRLLWVISTLFTGGFMLVVYAMMAILLPYDDEVVMEAEVADETTTESE